MMESRESLYFYTLGVRILTFNRTVRVLQDEYTVDCFDVQLQGHSF